MAKIKLANGSVFEGTASECVAFMNAQGQATPKAKTTKGNAPMKAKAYAPVEFTANGKIVKVNGYLLAPVYKYVVEHFEVTANKGEFTCTTNAKAKALVKKMNEFQATNECQELVNAHYAPKAVKTRQKGCADRNFERAVKSVHNRMDAGRTKTDAINASAKKFGVDVKALTKACK